MNAKMLVPNYLKDFSCIGGDCEDTCCSGFDISIDEKTYEKYQTVKDRAISNDLKKHIKYNQNKRNEFEHGSINAKCDCPFLSEDGWCRIQMELGESYLSSTCYTFPKQTNAINKRVERAATLSCPEIARLVLKKEEGLSFEEEEGRFDERDLISKHITDEMSPVVPYFDKIRDFTIKTLQNRRYKLEERLCILEDFSYKLQGIIQVAQPENIEALIESYKHDLNFVDFKEDEVDANAIIETIIGVSELEPFVERYEETFKETLMGLQDLNAKVGNEFLDKNEYILENYLVNYVFKEIFPFSFGSTAVEAFKMIKLQYWLIKLHIVGVASYYNKINLDIIVRVVQSWTKEADHNTSYLEGLYQNIMRQ